MKRKAPILFFMLLSWLMISSLFYSPVLASPATEDFTTWVEVDIPQNRLTVNANRVTFSGVKRIDSVYVYKNYSLTPFDGSFEHNLDVLYSSSDYNGFVCLWGMYNTHGDREDARGSPASFYSVYFGGESGDDNAKIVLQGYYNGTQYLNPQWVAPIVNTVYYLKIKRLATTLSCDIYADATNRTQETNALAELSGSLPVAESFEYLIVSQSLTYSGQYPMSGYVENLEFFVPNIVTFYFNEGGEFRVDNVTIVNGSSESYSNGTVIELASLPQNSSYVFSYFDWNTNNATTNPYNLTITEDLTVWLYFSIPSVDGDYFGFAFLFFGLFLGVVVGLLLGDKR